jgi:hypothetical protein
MHGTHLEAGPARVLVTVAALAALLAPLLFASGCGSSAAINQYTTFANQILSSLNAQEGELKKYWTLPLVQQDGLNKSIAELRKTIADAQAKMDSTDRPQECAALDETLGRAVDQSRELADITTQLGDYLGALAPMAKQADEIVTGLNKLQDSQDVRSSVSGYLSKARSLESSTRTLNPAAQYQQINDLFVGFVADMAKRLQSASDKLSKAEPTTVRDPQGERTDEEQAALDAQIARERKAQVDSVASDTAPIIDDWEQFNAEAGALIDEARQASGLKSKTAEVEGLIGQAISQIQSLEKQYK